MADEKDLESLAKRYLDVWESQLAGMAADSDLAAQLGRLFAATNSALLAGLKAPQTASQMAPMTAAGAFDAAQQSGHAGPANPPTHATPGTATIAAPSGHGGLDLGEFADRLAALERRLAGLERVLERLTRQRDES
ncbi:MAG: hypothetical protein ABI439_14965 [Rhodospirillales bacterium]